MKRVLIIAYLFPPITNMGSHRILRFVRHFREVGWEPIVLTGEFKGWSQTDEHLLERIPPDIQVHRVGSVDLTGLWQRLRDRGRKGTEMASTAGVVPVRAHGLSTFLNRWVMIPDKYFPWIPPAARVGDDLVRRNQITAIYSTSDPVSDHLVARRISRQTGVPFVAEFRDLWLGSPYFARAHPTPLHRALHARLEKQVVNSTSVVVGLSRGIQQYFATSYPACRSRVIYNCFDPEEYPPAPPPSATFTVLYAGAFYSSRSPEPFMAGFSQFVQRHRLAPSDAKFVIVGGSTDLDLRAMACRQEIEPYVDLVSRLPHKEALARMQSATALLAVQSPEDNVHVPGKLFEYIGARRPIFAMSRPCEVAEMITQHRLGWVAAPDPTDVAAKLDEVYAAWKTLGHAALTIAAADRFGIRETTAQAAALLDEVAIAR
jgi:glycosyltransferase involved in cell wall biosynthesis